MTAGLGGEAHTTPAYVTTKLVEEVAREPPCTGEVCAGRRGDPGELNHRSTPRTIPWVVSLENSSAYCGLTLSHH